MHYSCEVTKKQKKICWERETAVILQPQTGNAAVHFPGAEREH